MMLNNNNNNDHIYCLDLESGIIFRAVGLTHRDYLIVYPKYFPDVEGERNLSGRKYKGLRFPTESVRFLNESMDWQTKNVGWHYSKTYHSFVPGTNRNKVKVFGAREYLPARLSHQNPLRAKTGELLKVFCGNSHHLTIDDFGIDASILVGLDNDASDIDLIIYSTQKAGFAKEAFQELEGLGIISGPNNNPEFFLERRRPYSPLMSDSEILLWEKAKMSGTFMDTKFSIMVKNLNETDNNRYLDTNQFVAIRFTLNQSLFVCDPGYIYQKHWKNLEILFGPKNIKVKMIITHLPEKMGAFLPAETTIFVVGKAYRIAGSYDFAVTQFIWDDEPVYFRKRFVMKIENAEGNYNIGQLINFNDPTNNI